MAASVQFDEQPPVGTVIGIGNDESIRLYLGAIEGRELRSVTSAATETRTPLRQSRYDHVSEDGILQLPVDKTDTGRPYPTRGGWGCLRVTLEHA